MTSDVEKDGTHDATLVDFRGKPVDKSRTGGWLAAGLILGEFNLHSLSVVNKLLLLQND